MLNRIQYIIKFIFKVDNGKYRLTYLFPVISSLIGAYIIFMIFSIMTSLSDEIEERISSFHYKYYYKENNMVDKYYKKNVINKGEVNIVYTDIYNTPNFINYFSFENVNKYLLNKIDKYVISNNMDFRENDIIIGHMLAKKLNIEIGDSLRLFFPSEINISTRIIPSEIKYVYGIFDIDLINLDNNSIIGQLNKYNVISNNYNYYFDNLDENDVDYNENLITSNFIIKGLKLEKKLYYFFGYLVILISCFMLFQINVQFIKEKNKQFSQLELLGFTKKKMSLIILINNLFLVSFMTITGIALTNITIYLNKKFNLFDFIYSALQYDIQYVSIVNNETLLLIFIMNIITLTSTIIPMYIISKTTYVKF